MTLIIFLLLDEFRKISTDVLFLLITISNFFHLWTYHRCGEYSDVNQHPSIASTYRRNETKQPWNDNANIEYKSFANLHSYVTNRSNVIPNDVH